MRLLDLCERGGDVYFKLDESGPLIERSYKTSEPPYEIHY